MYTEEVDVHHVDLLLLDLGQGRDSRDEGHKLLGGFDSDGNMPVLCIAWRMKGPLQELLGVVEPAIAAITHHAGSTFKLSVKTNIVDSICSYCWSIIEYKDPSELPDGDLSKTPSITAGLSERERGS